MILSNPTVEIQIVVLETGVFLFVFSDCIRFLRSIVAQKTIPRPEHCSEVYIFRVAHPAVCEPLEPALPPGVYVSRAGCLTQAGCGGVGRGREGRAASRAFSSFPVLFVE